MADSKFNTRGATWISPDIKGNFVPKQVDHVFGYRDRIAKFIRALLISEDGEEGGGGEMRTLGRGSTDLHFGARLARKGSFIGIGHASSNFEVVSKCVDTLEVERLWKTTPREERIRCRSLHLPHLGRGDFHLSLNESFLALHYIQGSKIPDEFCSSCLTHGSWVYFDCFEWILYLIRHFIRSRYKIINLEEFVIWNNWNNM